MLASTCFRESPAGILAPASSQPPSATTVGSITGDDAPQERMERLGPTSLLEAELLSLILRTGTQARGVRLLAQDLMNASGSLQHLMRWKREDFCSLPGLGRVKSAQLTAVFEIARRLLASPEPGATEKLDTPQRIVAHMRTHVAGLDVEKFWILCLNRRLRLIRTLEVTSGTATSSLVHPREVFREAIRAGSCAVVCVHNHPSGDPTPSTADIQVTRQLRQAGQTLDIDLVDHVVMGTRSADPKGLGYHSFRESGVL